MTTFNAALLALVLTTGAVAASPASAGPDLLVNGGFETGNLAGWSMTGNLSPQQVSTGFDGFAPLDGNYFLWVGQNGSDGVLSQTFADVADGTLTVTGYLASNGVGASDFSVSIDGIAGYSVTPIPVQGYQEFSFSVTATGSDTISLTYRNDPGYSAIDDLSVTEVMPVPEPATAAIVCAALIGLGIVRARGRRGHACGRNRVTTLPRPGAL
jgi:hypothetical protein